ncbi:hypothetical protein CryarDRAFT_2992 [Cryptosporangium arvum DSM 44712]|uniref:Uncharacterized protein n=1 Tax=Cryptosporangium arvum DSM 44712 TaxID=927661 RepID=A0A011AIM9_9ACTN|nr:hypothetical protein CryarDRAFT_2992 [Cryptosporangium arvum DSM 44712]
MRRVVLRWVIAAAFAALTLLVSGGVAEAGLRINTN